MSHEPWDDERLTTAFTERARPHVTPPALAVETVEAVRAGRRLQTVSPWRPWMAAAAVVVLAVAVVGVSLPRSSGPAPSRPATPSAATAEPQGVLPAETGGPAFTPSSVADLPVMTIEEAVAVRDAGVDDREIKVAGWLPPDRIYSCPLVPASPPPAPLQPGCGSVGDQLYGAANLGTGQTLRVYLGGVDVAWRPGPGTSPSTRVELVGHFDDRRAQACPIPPDCADRLVVDQVSSADGAAVPLSLDLDRYLPSSVQARWTPQELEDLFASYGQVLSMVVMPISSLGSMEPTVSAFAREPQDRLVWRVQVLADDHALTFLVEDVGDSAHEVEDDGSVSSIPLASLPAIRPDDTVLGLPLLDVGQAAAIRDGGVDDQEIAVRGWLASLAVPCPSTGAEPAAPFGISCENSFTWLSGSADQPGTDGPVGPSIRPVFQFADVFGSAPQQAILIGHFDDRRSNECSPGTGAACGDWFIVDRTGSAPTGYLTTYLTDAPTRTNAVGVESSISVESPDGKILSMVVLPDGGLGAVEPSIGNRRRARTAFDGIVWRAQVLEDGHATTYLFPDEGDALYEMNTDGDPVLVSGETPASPDPSLAAWPPPDAAYLITLNSPIGVGKPPVRVAIVDPSSRLASVEVPPGSDQGIAIPEGERAWVAGEAGADARTVRLAWVGTICDHLVTVTIDPALDAIQVDGGSRPACDAMAVERQVVLTFEHPVDPAAITVTYTETLTGG
jgi:hypothetical protein